MFRIKALPVLIPATSLGLVLLIGLLAGKLVSLALSPEVALPVGSLEQAAPAPSQSSEPDITPTDNARALFGQSAISAASLQSRDLEDTDLDIELIGIIDHADSDKSRAMILTKRNGSRAFSVDDRIPGGALIRDIHVDRVVLSHQGRIEQLRLAREPLAVETLSSDAVDEPLKLNREALISALKPRPVQLDDGASGLSVDPDPDGVWAQKTGLQPGDVILKVNARDLSDPQGLAEDFRLLGSGDALTIDLLRDGARREITISMDEL